MNIGQIHLPPIIAIEEYALHKSYKFATTPPDLTHHKIYGVFKIKKNSDIEGALISYKDRGECESSAHGLNR